MKKITFLFLIITASIFAQDYSKSSKDELIKIINSKENALEESNKSLEKEKLENKKKALDGTNKSSEETIKLKTIIKETNIAFLRESFENKYINNKTYFKDTDLVDEDNTKKFEKSNILINSIMVDEVQNEVLNICKYALDFNKNYLKLFEIRKSVLSEKYNEAKLNEALNEIEMLPVLELNSKLDITKKRITNVLKNYIDNTCLLKKKLDALKNADQSPIIKQKYTTLEKDDHFKDYPYLIQIIKNIKKNVINYNSKEDLQPCAEINKSPIETSNTETKI